MFPRHLRPSATAAGLVLTCALWWDSSHGQSVKINEFLASNVQVAPDNVDFDDYSDWIELRNTTAAPVSLAGYYLTDDPGRPIRWPFPNATTIPANGFLMIRADGFDAGPGETFRRE
ncbi:MAG: lamin tail domain-containing protein [Roseibacillus sp.]|jgi:hypothetical protein